MKGLGVELARTASFIMGVGQFLIMRCEGGGAAGGQGG